MAEYKLGFYGEEIDLKLQQIEALHKSVTQLEKNDTDINAAITSINNAINELKLLKGVKQCSIIHNL